VCQCINTNWPNPKKRANLPPPQADLLFIHGQYELAEEAYGACRFVFGCEEGSRVIPLYGDKASETLRHLTQQRAECRSMLGKHEIALKDFKRLYIASEEANGADDPYTLTMKRCVNESEWV
jgi:hypothetical protein